MKISAVRDLSGEELAIKLDELRELSMKLRFQNATAQLDSPVKIRNAKRAIARVLTVQNQRKKEAVKADTEK